MISMFKLFNILMLLFLSSMASPALSNSQLEMNDKEINRLVNVMVIEELLAFLKGHGSIFGSEMEKEYGTNDYEEVCLLNDCNEALRAMIAGISERHNKALEEVASPYENASKRSLSFVMEGIGAEMKVLDELVKGACDKNKPTCEAAKIKFDLDAKNAANIDKFRILLDMLAYVGVPKTVIDEKLPSLSLFARILDGVKGVQLEVLAGTNPKLNRQISDLHRKINDKALSETLDKLQNY
jgi:hypothetical protein